MSLSELNRAAKDAVNRAERDNAIEQKSTARKLQKGIFLLNCAISSMRKSGSEARVAADILSVYVNELQSIVNGLVGMENLAGISADELLINFANETEP